MGRNIRMVPPRVRVAILALGVAITAAACSTASAAGTTPPVAKTSGRVVAAAHKPGTKAPTPTASHTAPAAHKTSDPPASGGTQVSKDVCHVFTDAELAAIMGTASFTRIPGTDPHGGNPTCTVKIPGPSSLLIELQPPSAASSQVYAYLKSTATALDPAGHVITASNGFVDDAMLKGGYVLTAQAPQQLSGPPLPGAEDAMKAAMEAAYTRWAA